MGIYLNGRNFVPMGYINRISANTDEVSASVENLIREADEISTIISNDLSVALHTLSSGDNEFTGTNSFRKIEVYSVSVSSMNAERIESLDEGQQYKLFIKSGENLYQIPYDTFIGQVSSMILPLIMSSLTGNTFITFSDGDMEQYMWTGTISPETMIQEGLRNSDGTWNVNPKTIKIGTNVNGIGTSSFSDCEMLEKIKIPSSVETIGASAFYNCSSLTDVDYRENASGIVLGMTDYPWGLGKYLDGVVEHYTTVTISCSDDNIFIVQAPMTTRVWWNETVFSDKEIEGTFSGDELSIEGHTKLDAVKIEFGRGVTGIGDTALRECTSLTSVTIPDSVTSIGDNAFYGCTSLTNVTISNSVTSIGSYAFYNTPFIDNKSSGLVILGKVLYLAKGITDTEVTIPDTVVSISPRAFEYLNRISNVTIPDSVEGIGFGAFSGCTSLTNVTIPNSVISIGRSAFDSTPFFINQPDGLVVLGKVAYKVKGDDLSQFTSVTIPDYVVSISPYAFRGCSSLANITIPNSVTSIGDFAFQNCTSLANITIPNSVTSIGGTVFANCSSLPSVTIPNSVTSIGNNAFYRCTSLTSLVFLDMESVEAVKSKFSNCNDWGVADVDSVIQVQHI